MASKAANNAASHSQIGKALGISQPAVTKLVAKGMPVESVQRAREWYDVWKVREGADINVVRKHKLQREVERLDIKIKKEKGELVLASQVAEESQMIAAILSSEGQAMISDLRGQLAGLDEITIGERITARWTQLLQRTQQRLGLG
jgi:predicted transcriptional regulator